jgi:hypothetical protein
MRGSNRLALTGLTIGILRLFSVAGLEACLLRGTGGAWWHKAFRRRSIRRHNLPGSSPLKKYQPTVVVSAIGSSIRPSQVDDNSGNRRRAGNFTEHRSADFLDTVFLRTYIKNYY